jgi:hypothetical protein
MLQRGSIMAMFGWITYESVEFKSVFTYKSVEFNSVLLGCSDKSVGST